MQFIVSRHRNCALYPPVGSAWAHEVKFDTASNCTNFERERVDEVRRWLDNYYAPAEVSVKEDRPAELNSFWRFFHVPPPRL